jgi:hypothetical protein
MNKFIKCILNNNAEWIESVSYSRNSSALLGVFDVETVDGECNAANHERTYYAKLIEVNYA